MQCIRLQKSVQKTGGNRLKINYPCGKCKPCRITKRQEWTGRILLEARRFSANLFVTLTYSPENLPEHGSLCKDDIQRFLKRLRKNTGAKIRYMAVGEYGSKTGRAHYHLIIFGADQFELETLIIKGKVITRCKEIHKSWGLGHTTADLLNKNRARYVAGYCLKKIADMTLEDLDRMLENCTDEKKRAKIAQEIVIQEKRLGGERGIRTPECMYSSRFPGIGLHEDDLEHMATALSKHGKNAEDIHMFRLDGKKWPMARTMRDKLKKLQEDIKQRTPLTNALAKDLKATQDYINWDDVEKRIEDSLHRSNRMEKNRIANETI